MSLLTHAVEIAPSPVALLRSRDVSNADREVAAGRLFRVRRGILAPRRAWAALPPWDRYLARVHAVATVYPEAVFTHESAAVLWGMPVLGDPQTVHVTNLPGHSAGHRNGIRVHTTGDDCAAIDVGGILLTRPASTAVTMARSRHPALGLACADAALRLEPGIDRADLLAANAERTSPRGRRLAQWSLTRADPRSASTLESFSRATIEWLGFAEPELQHPFFTAHGTAEYSDFWWSDQRLVGEADGDFKYDGRFGDGLTQLQLRRERDLRLLAGQAEHIAHWGWPELRLVDPVRSALAGAGLRAVRPEDSVALASFRHLLHR